MHPFHLGSLFSSYKELKRALVKYRKEANVEFCFRDCKFLKKLSAIGIEKAARANPELIYYMVKLTCVRGGRRHKPKGIGLRKTQTWKTGCQAFINLTLSDCGKFLKVTNLDLSHNHELFLKPISKDKLRVERTRKRIMQAMKISYDEASQIERHNFYMEHPDELLKIPSKTKKFIYDSSSSEEDGEINESGNSFEEDSNSIRNTLTSTATKESVQVYTKSGDSGNTYTFNGQEKHKDDSIFEALGTAEELSSSIGYAIECLPESCDTISVQLREIQCVLQDLAVHIGTPKNPSSVLNEASHEFEFPETHVTNLERWIDRHTQKIPKTTSIILPSGGKGSSALHMSRAVCRRAERRVVCLLRNYEMNKTSLQYLNRLGDYLFVAARRVSLETGNIEHLYKKPELEPQSCKVIYLSQSTS